MSIVVNDKGQMVITMRLLDSPAADVLALRRSIIHLVQNQDGNDLPGFEQYRVLELLKELELTEEQNQKVFIE